MGAAPAFEAGQTFTDLGIGRLRMVAAYSAVAVMIHPLRQ